MAEETEQDTGAAGADPVAMGMLINRASSDVDEELKAYLRDQRHHLHEQLKRAKMGVISDRLSITLKVLTGFVGLAVAAGLALMIWDAAHANGLIIESFSVPPDMASRGLSGQVVAGQMLDKLTAMQNVSV